MRAAPADDAQADTPATAPLAMAPEKVGLLHEDEPVEALGVPINGRPLQEEPPSAAVRLLWRAMPVTRKLAAVLAPFGLFCTPTMLTFYIVMSVTREGPTPTLSLKLAGVVALAALCARGCAKRWHAAAAAGLGVLFALQLLHTVIFVDGEPSSSTYPAVETDHKRIAIIGAGPSGLGALWFLKLRSPNRDVTLFEEKSYIGGHSTTVYDGDSPPIDIGFIFSTMRYETYMLLNEQYNVSRRPSVISVAYHGTYDDETRPAGPFADWNNLGGDLTHGEPELAAEIDRFRQFIAAEPTLFRALMPLGPWLWYEGFSADFTERVLRPLLTPLFVTAKGCMWQPAQATIGHFGSAGFLSLDLSIDQSPPLFHTIGGVNGMYQQVLRDAKLPASQLRMKTRVVNAKRLAHLNKWQLTSHGPNGRKVELFDDVIFACNARVAASVLEEESAPSVSWLLHNIDYDGFDVRLHRVNDDDPVRTSTALYHVYPNAEMVGSIDRILDVGDGKYKLEVFPQGRTPPSRQDGRLVTTRSWEHHRFSLWELMLTHRVLPRINHKNGLHIAGDWTFGVGQNDALKSGMRAACAAGVPLAAKQELAKRAGNNHNTVHQCLLPGAS